MENISNQLADAAIRIMKANMPGNATTYLESSMLWGRIWQEMRNDLACILQEPTI